MGQRMKLLHCRRRRVLPRVFLYPQKPENPQLLLQLVSLLTITRKMQNIPKKR